MKRTIKYTIALFTIIGAFNFTHAQKVDLGNYDMEIIEVFNRNSVGSAFSGKNKKYVGLEVMLIPKSKKNDGFVLSTMLMRSDGEDYTLIYKRGATVHLQGQLIKLKKPTKILIFALVDKKFTNGDLIFNENKIVSIEVKDGSKIGTYTILE
jgi:hypothetical protein